MAKLAYPISDFTQTAYLELINKAKVRGRRGKNAIKMTEIVIALNK